MARPKKNHKKSDPNIQEIVEIEVEFVCPVRGKVKQKVKMKKLKSVKFDPRQVVNNSDEIDKIDNISLDEEELPLEE